MPIAGMVGHRATLAKSVPDPPRSQAPRWGPHPVTRNENDPWGMAWSSRTSLDTPGVAVIAGIRQRSPAVLLPDATPAPEASTLADEHLTSPVSTQAWTTSFPVYRPR